MAAVFTKIDRQRLLGEIVSLDYGVACHDALLSVTVEHL